MLVLLLTLWAGGALRGDEPSADDLAFFESRIRPLLVERCFECHSRASEPLQGGLRLDRADAIAAGGESGAVLVPGQPDESRLIVAVRYGNPDLQMPPDGKLSDDQIADLVAWVARGASYPAAAEEQDGDAPAARTIDIEAGRRHWAFQPLRLVAVPPVSRPGWARRRIDAFLLARLESQGLSPSPEADRRTLIRRLYFDLIGLPPTPEEVETFVADTSPEARERLVERLLASPHYGERWGRYWLDLVRYCDVPESWAVSDAQAWLYRDWVVQALNDDLPYDQFVLRQLAADQLEDFRPQDVAALGLLGLSPSYWKELKLAPDVIKTVVAEEWEERINTLGSTLLGLTVACARCHDHKFDPITTADYYGLAGVLASVRQTPLPMLPPEEARAVGAAHLEVKFLLSEAERFTAIGNQDPAQAEEMKRQAEQARARSEEIKLTTPHYDAPLAYAIEDAALAVLPDGPHRTRLEYQPGAAQDVAMQLRGNPAKEGPVVPRRFLSVLSPGEPQPFAQGSGRRELGEAIFRDAGPLAARVIVNRVWRHHFGRGLVETPSNFGTQGEPPSHPELLEDLAARFVAAGWSLKWLHREIVLSAAYGQASADNPPARTVDPENRLLWRFSRRRLDVEAWRDAMLAAAGNLDDRLGGAPQELADAGHRRRTIYSTVKRRELDDLLRLYDFPDPTGHSPARDGTITPLQQLYVLNGGFVARQAAALATRVQAERPVDFASQIDWAYRLLYARAPTDRERSLAAEFFAAAGGPQGADAWQQYAEALLGSNELMFVD
jgi:hypothetical protein